MSERSRNYKGIVDMGSNGIRFSITDLNPEVSAGLPTLYLSRAAISLYDAQFSAASPDRQPIAEATIDRVIKTLLRFKETCNGFGMRDDQIEVLATEATRVASNSDNFIHQIKGTLGSAVRFRLLAKEDEGRTGAWGVASSLHNVTGLMMDLGGGSAQLSWLVCIEGDVQMPLTGSVSLPYGAAALSRRLKEANNKGGGGKEGLLKEIVRALGQALKKLQPLPKEIQHAMDDKTLRLYVSGGGFRGWGYVLMSMHPLQPYPVPIINGFRVDAPSFFSFQAVQPKALPAAKGKAGNDHNDTNIFRVSERRKSQVPAVAFLVQCLDAVLKHQIESIFFCQGGVREGSLYQHIPKTDRGIPPLWQACINAMPPRNHLQPPEIAAKKDFTMKPFVGLIEPKNPLKLPNELLLIPKAISIALYHQAPMPKDLRAACALRSTTAGPLAAARGLSHFERAATAIALSERWGGYGDLSPSDIGFYDRLLKLITIETGANNVAAWWCIVIGRLGAVVGEFYPAGLYGRQGGADMHTRWEWEGPQKEVRLMADFTIDNRDGESLDDAVWKALRRLEKCGKKKNWPNGYGLNLSLDLRINGEQSEMPEKTPAAEDDD